jgi:hypothetical protein
MQEHMQVATRHPTKTVDLSEFVSMLVVYGRRWISKFPL